MPRVSSIGIPSPNLSSISNNRALAGPPIFNTGSLASSPVTLTGSTSNAVGAWTELTNAIPETSVLYIILAGMAIAATDTRGLVDIGVGAAGSEVTIISSLPAGHSNNIGSTSTGLHTMVPIRIPAGSRLVARLRSFIASDTVSLWWASYQDPIGFNKSGVRYLASYVDTYGADTANSRGTNVPGNNTYTQITASTTQPYRLLLPLPCGGGGTTWTTLSTQLSVAIGASGSEVELKPSSGFAMVINFSVSEDVSSEGNVFHLGYHTNSINGIIPAGSRIACKYTGSLASTYTDVIVLGIP